MFFRALYFYIRSNLGKNISKKIKTKQEHFDLENLQKIRTFSLLEFCWFLSKKV